MLKIGKKAEQQAFAGKGLDYVTDKYLPDRLKEIGGDLIDKRAAYAELKENYKNVRFNRICSLAELFGFRFRGGK
jgi:hypothetical protein